MTGEVPAALPRCRRQADRLHRAVTGNWRDPCHDIDGLSTASAALFDATTREPSDPTATHTRPDGMVRPLCGNQARSLLISRSGQFSSWPINPRTIPSFRGTRRSNLSFAKHSARAQRSGPHKIASRRHVLAGIGLTCDAIFWRAPHLRPHPLNLLGFKCDATSSSLMVRVSGQHTSFAVSLECDGYAVHAELGAMRRSSLVSQPG